MSVKAHVNLLSQPARALVLFLKATEIPHEIRIVNLRQGEHKTEEFIKLNPFSKVPVIEDDGFVLTESVAILRYLAREKNVADHWYPSDSKKQAKVDEYLEWQHTNARLLCMRYFRYKFLDPLFFGHSVEEQQVVRYQEDMENCLKQIETVWLCNGKKFITGDEISVADLLAVCELEQPTMAGYDVFSKYPIIGQWKERVKKEVDPHYEEVHQVVRMMTSKFGGVPDVTKL